METLEEDGEWWLPGAPERRVAGRLTFSVDDGGQLRLVGSLVGGPFGDGPDVGSASRDEVDGYPRIYGQVGHQPYTLENCLQSRFNRNLFGGLPSETISVGQIYRGVWYEDDEDVCGDQISVGLAHLVYWVRPRALSLEWHRRVEADGEAELPVFEMTASSLPTVEIPRPTGTIELVQSLGSDGDGIASRSISQDVIARFETDRVLPWRDLMSTVGQLRDVVSLAMDRMACIESVSLWHPDVAYAPRKGKASRTPIEVFASWSDRAAWVEPKDQVAYHVLFHHSVVGDDGLARLLDTASAYRPELRRVVATQEGRTKYNSDRLLNHCAALESFDRKRRGAKDDPFRTRIRACMDLAGEPFTRLVGDPERWLDGLRRRRNHTAHHLENDDESDGVTDLVMADTTYFLFVLVFLREAAMPPEVFDLFEKNSRVEWLRRLTPTVLVERSAAG